MYPAVHVTPVPYGASMTCDNPSGADNQQERPSPTDWLDAIPRDLGNWVAGFVDGEGSFNVPIRRERDRGMPWPACQLRLREWESSEAIRKAPCRSTGMKIWSTPHGDMGNSVNYNGESYQTGRG